MSRNIGVRGGSRVGSRNSSSKNALRDGGLYTEPPQHFQEPRLENLTRKVYALLNERFGVDKNSKSEDGQPQPIVTKVVIVMSTGFRVDS